MINASVRFHLAVFLCNLYSYRQALWPILNKFHCFLHLLYYFRLIFVADFTYQGWLTLLYLNYSHLLPRFESLCRHKLFILYNVLFIMYLLKPILLMFLLSFFIVLIFIFINPASFG